MVRKTLEKMEKLSITVPKEILEYIKEREKEKKAFSSVSHAFQVMAFEYMEANPLKKK